jgi:hypothetical protein
MINLEISLVVLLCLMAGFFLGLGMQRRLPDHHLSKESQDTIKLGAGIVATMSALILGLLVSSAKNSFDHMNASIAQNGARIIQLDQLLAEYGPETRVIRDQLKNSIAERVKDVWNPADPHSSGMKALEKATTMLDLQCQLQTLTPQTGEQKSVLNQSQQIATQIWQDRLLMMEEQQEPIPMVFLVLLVFWLSLLFLSFGLFAPVNVTVVMVLLTCAVAVASAVFLILEMSHPLDGLIKVSNAPMLKALELMGH